ncbi:type II secretion system protein GspM [Stenotrophomonas maltophilia]|uniref:type II secretion system protein GspM n=2 Tax=Stenotrophomonas TaxID=40323 RepID=UPI00066EA5FD|nr:general secretion pathway protein GspM [Stenotrophomonas maltophilia]NUH60189.1 general secretion pathway protein GspM [Stenotrophomonas maltophilia]PZS63353.1 general secretion pathway protein GspM [Stenotrophomonas maltophilia]HDS1554500.1 general secretion pathway protein GspM [Stenotrophomonas maltophilia]HDS1623684.1 general secretion pathway protein GspM [Stenotrophomonas maltophilia]
MPMPSARRDRWLALALLLAVLGLAYLLLVHPWFTQPLREIDADVAALRERESRVQAQLQQKPQIEQRLRATREALQQRPGFLREATAEAAAAALGAKLQDAVAMASPGNRSCTISNRTPLTDNRRDAEFVRVAMQVRLRCGVAELATVLHSLETGSPRLFVDNLNLIAQRFQQSPNESGLGLDVSFELAGYLLPGAAADGSAPAPATEPVSAPQPPSAAPAPAPAAPVEGQEVADET